VIIGPLLVELCHSVIYLKEKLPFVIVNNDPDPEYDPFQANDAIESVETVAEIVKYTPAGNEIGFVVYSHSKIVTITGPSTNPIAYEMVKHGDVCEHWVLPLSTPATEWPK
jgi:hypothetical protein